MKFEFAATVTIQITGEAEGTSEELGIFTAKKVTVLPAVVFLPKEALQELSVEDQQEVMHYISHHVVKRAEEALRPAVKPTEMVPVNNQPDPDKRN